MKTRDMLPRKYLSKEDLWSGTDYDEWILTITRCSLEDMPGDDDEQKWILFFKEVQKGLALNGTNIKFLERELSDESDNWPGRKVVLFFDPAVMFKGQPTGGLRLKSPRPPKPVIQPRTSVAKSPPAPDSFDDGAKLP